ncbi:MAG: hypothetical protein LPH21_11600 [Shewanella sp.]|nr:hypothetical protein [Shewanella sp.]
MPNLALTETTLASPATAQRAVIFTNLRQSAAMAAGLEALAVRALETGDTEQALETIADMATLLHQHLSRTSQTLADLAE